ncbi:MAG: transcriptional activator [Ardenticatenaceae bacterium]|nr:MAG: transcriptional activator [Ardenticatenaceae bacterium]
MAELSLAVLGSFLVEYDQRPLTQFRTKIVQGLLVYLVCQPRQTYRREVLMTLFWPDVLLKSSQANLRHALYHLRQAIPAVNNAAGEAIPFVLADRYTIQLNPDGRFQVDLHQFEMLTRSAASMEDLETAVSLYRDDFLTGFYLPDSPAFENWIQEKRTNYQRLFLNTLSRLTQNHIENGKLNEAQKTARRQLEIDNLREEAHGQLMRILALNGRRTDALSHYQTLRQLLQDELGIMPSATIEALVEAIRNDMFQDKATDVGHPVVEETSSLVPYHLPPQTTPFIGRQTELVALDDLLAAPQTRLVTILGQGGMGKTRLSLAVAERQLMGQKFGQGVFFVALAGLSETDRIVSAIAEAMQILLEKGESQLLNYLKAKEILLVLDNYEHLLAGRDLVSRLLQAAPNLQVLVTSRERLRLQGEQVYPIQGLSLDDTAVTDDARTLFLEAARRLRPDFQVTAEELPRLNQICRLVEGMPLALELAASWVDLFTLRDISAEIRRNITFLESDLQDVPSRHRSMQAVFDTSWQQLPPNLQQVLAAMGVFRGGFRREAATAITQASLRDLAVLSNKSLIRFDASTNRYDIHELLRQYLLTHLPDTAVQEHHCDYYLDWLDQQSSKLIGTEQSSSAAKVKQEMDNIRAAINHAMQIQKVDRFVQMMETLNTFYSTQHLSSAESMLLFDHIRIQLAANPKTPIRILYWATAHQVNALGSLGQSTRARRLWQKGQAYLATLNSQENDLRAEKAFAYYIEGFDLYIEQPNQARQLLQKSYNLFRELGDPTRTGMALSAMALAARNQGDLDAAKVAITEALEYFEKLKNREAIVHGQIVLSELTMIEGRYEEAERGLIAIVDTSRQNRLASLFYALNKLVLVYISAGQLKKARVTIAEERLLIEGYDYTWATARDDLYLGLLNLHEGRYLEAKEIAAHALHRGQKHGASTFICWSLALLALAEIALGNDAGAKAWHQESDQHCPGRFIFPPISAAGNHLCWGIVAVVTGETAAAHQHFNSELESALKSKGKLNLANVIAVVAFLHAVEEKPVAAIELYALAKQHPFVANSRWFADVVEKKITAVSASLSPQTIAEAKERGGKLDMWKTASSMLD